MANQIDETIKPGAAFLADEAENPTPELDRLTDAAGMPYDKARLMLGMEAVDQTVESTSMSTTVTAKPKQSRGRRGRPIETRYTDIGSDLAAILEAPVPEEDVSQTDGPTMTTEEAKAQIARRNAASQASRAITDAGGNPSYSLALLRARQERH